MGCGASSDASSPLAIMPEAAATAGGGVGGAGAGASSTPITRAPSGTGAVGGASNPAAAAASDAPAPSASPRASAAPSTGNGTADPSNATQPAGSTPRGGTGAHSTPRASSVPARNSVEIAAANAAAFAQGLPPPNAPPARVVTDPRTTAEGLRGALLPNFYRMQAGGAGINPNTPGGGALSSKRGPISDATGSVGDYDSSLDDTTQTGVGGVSMWGGASDDEEELDDEDHEETMHMLHELTMLAVPTKQILAAQQQQQQPQHTLVGGYRHGSMLSSDNGSDEQTARRRSSPTPSSNSTSTATTMTTATTAGHSTPRPSAAASSATAAGISPQPQQKGGANLAPAITLPAAGAAAGGSSAGSTPAPDGASSPSLSRKRLQQQQGRRATAAGGGTPSSNHGHGPSLHLSDTLFHGFYAKRCITSVKKSMASSGLYLVYKDMFTSIDTTGSGSITKKDWAALMGKLGLPLESATSLSRIVGLGGGGATSDSHITLEQFAMVMALSMHGPYVRLLQTTSSQNKKQVFLGGEKFTRSAGAAVAPAAASAAPAVAMASVGSTGNWRREIAIPIFKRERIPFFNPAGAGTGAGAAASPTPSSPSHASSASPTPASAGEDDDPWTAEAVILEALAKSQAHMMLFVVDNRTRSIASMVEASEHIVSEKEVILVLLDVAANSVIGNETITAGEAKDLNRGRAYLADVAHRNAHSGVTVFKDVALACEYIVKRWQGLIVKPSLQYFQKPVLMPMPHLMLPGPGAGVSLGGSQAGTASVTPRPGSSVAHGGLQGTPSPQVSPMVLARNTLPPSITLTPSPSPPASAALSPPGPGSSASTPGHHKSHSSIDAIAPVAASSNLVVSGGGLLSARRASGTASARRASHNANTELSNALASSPFGLSSPLSVMSSTVARRHSVGNKGGAGANHNMFLAAAALSPFAAEAAQAGSGAASKSATATPASVGGVISPAQTSATLSFPNPTSPSSPAVLSPAPAASPTASPTAASPGASAASRAFSVEDWPLHPAPSDFDRYIRSAHFAECGRIVFKHQVLLSRRAALKVAQQAQQAQAAAGLGLPSSAASTRGGASPSLLGVGGPGGAHAQPPGLFRAPSSPLVAGSKLLKHSGSSATLGSDGAANAGPMTMGSSTAAIVKPHPVHTTGLHIVTNSSPAASPLTPGVGAVAASVAAANAGTGSDAVSPEESRAAPSGVLLRVGSTSVSEAQMMSLTSAGENHLEHSSLGSGRSSALGSPTQRGGAGGMSGAKPETASTTPAGTRPPSTAGMHVNLVAPDGSSHPQTQAQLLAASSPPPLAPASALSPPPALKEEDELVPTFHLFTMLIRLHEIIQLSTGIHFLHPYPALVSEALEKSGERVGDSLPFAEWKIIAERVMSNLRGVYETTAGYDESQTASRAESPHHAAAGAAAAGAPAEAGTTNHAAAGATAAAAGSSMDHRRADEMRSNTGRVLPLSADPRRRSVSRFGTPRHTSMGLGLPVGGADLNAGPTYTGSSASSMSPSQFIRQMGHSRRSGSDADALTAGGAAASSPGSILSHGGSSRNVAAAAGALGSPAPMHPNTRVIGLGSGSKGDKPQSADPASKTNSAAVVARVRARLSAQQRAISNMTPGGVSHSASQGGSRHSPSLPSSPLGGLSGLAGGHPSTGDDIIWAQTLHSGDLDKLAQSLASSVAHDAMVLREMLPGFTSMFRAVLEASGVKGETVSMGAVRGLLAEKLLLPSDSCESLMRVLELARKSCWNAARSSEEAHAHQDSPAAAGILAAPEAGALPSKAFDPSSLSEQAFVALLAQSLHLSSSPFFHFLDPSFNFLAQSRSACSKVFLGGSCNPTTWRQDEAIPILAAAGVSFFNPQVDNWSQELVLIESLIKANCETLLFVIDCQTRAIASMIEASEYICSGRDVVLVVKNMPDSSSSAPRAQQAQVNNELLGPEQVRDLNRARSYVTDVAQRHGLDVFTNVGLACEYIVTKRKEKEKKEEQCQCTHIHTRRADKRGATAEQR